MEVNCRNKKSYNTAHYPIRQPILIVWLIWILSKIALLGKKYKVEKINMEGLRPPYMVLSNHMYFIDFELAAMVTTPPPREQCGQSGRLLPPSVADGADRSHRHPQIHHGSAPDQIHRQSAETR